MACVGKRKRAVLMLDDERQILERLEKGVTPSSLMQEFNCVKQQYPTSSTTRNEFSRIFQQWKHLVAPNSVRR